MLKKILIGAVLLSLVLIVVACAGPTSAPPSAPPASKPSTAQTPGTAQEPTPSPEPKPTPTPTPTAKPPGPIKGEWIDAQVNGDTVSISQSDVEKNWNVHFKVNMQGTTENFMAYLLDGEIYVRANVCPPCKSIGYSLLKDILVCDRCATTFKAKSGDGIEGACVKYPKAPVPYEVTGGKLVMKNSDLLVAYQNTLKQGWP